MGNHGCIKMDHKHNVPDLGGGSDMS